MANPKPSEEQVSEYRAALAALMARCLESIRKLPIPDDTTPILERRRDESVHD